MKIYTADKETGTFIEEFATIEEAKKAIEGYYAEDAASGELVEGFYDIVDGNHISIDY